MKGECMALPRKNTTSRNGFEVMVAAPGTKPDLMELYGEDSPVEMRGGARSPWHPATLAWWASLDDHPTMHGLTQAQWLDLASLAVLYDAVAKGSLKYRSALQTGLSAYLLTPADLRKHAMELATREAVAPVAGVANPAFEQWKAAQ